MDHGIEINSQVVHREKQRNCIVVRTGTVVSFKGDNNEIAVVAFQEDPRKGRSIQASSRRDVPVDKLETVQKVFGGGRSIVQSNPIHRSIGYLIQR